MSDELLPYYDKELEFMRQMGAEFALKHPKIAGRLRLDSDQSQDPHVERMIQAFAYMNARIRHKLDDDFPEISDAMLGVLYPHFLAPMPSMGIVQFSLDRSEGEQTVGLQIETDTPIEAERDDGEICRFKTRYPVTLWPFELTLAELTSRPFEAPDHPGDSEAAAVLRIQLRTYDPAVTFSQLDLESLRFYVHRPKSRDAFDLHELILNNTCGVALATSSNDSEPVVVPTNCVTAVGFDSDEGMIPYPARSFPGYRLLSEFFVFPQKFLFFDIQGMENRLERFGNTLELYLYLDRQSDDLSQRVSSETFRLGCAPVVNLFEVEADPFPMTGTQSEYRIIPDARHESALEVYSVDEVSASSADGEPRELHPFYSVKHSIDGAASRALWSATRRPARGNNAAIEPQSEMFLSLVDLDFSPSATSDWTIHMKTTCFNREVQRLKFSGSRPSLKMADSRGPVTFLSLGDGLLTKTYRPAFKRANLWKLISHLSLNHLSITGGGEGLEALREILQLYDVVNDENTRGMIEGIVEVDSRRVVARAGGPAAGFCRGVEVEVHFDESKFTGGGAYLFSCVLSHFLGMYASINSFTRLLAISEQRQGQGEPWRWPPRAGERALL